MQNWAQSPWSQKCRVKGQVWRGSGAFGFRSVLGGLYAMPIPSVLPTELMSLFSWLTWSYLDNSSLPFRTASLPSTHSSTQGPSPVLILKSIWDWEPSRDSLKDQEPGHKAVLIASCLLSYCRVSSHPIHTSSKRRKTEKPKNAKAAVDIQCWPPKHCSAACLESIAVSGSSSTQETSPFHCQIASLKLKKSSFFTEFRRPFESSRAVHYLANKKPPINKNRKNHIHS